MYEELVARHGRMTLYLVRYYDWDYECGLTLGLFRSLTEVHAYLTDEYEGRFLDAAVVEPRLSGYSVSNYPVTDVAIDEAKYGEIIEIERLDVDA